VTSRASTAFASFLTAVGAASPNLDAGAPASTPGGGSADGGAGGPADDGDDDYTAPVYMPDNAAGACSLCGAAFTMLLQRRHHCRSCGSLICNTCSRGRLRGHRACDTCVAAVRGPAATPTPPVATAGAASQSTLAAVAAAMLV
jgi:hypothetical protein